MARKRKPTEINLTIDFGRRIFHDDTASMYEAKDTVTSNRLLVFITDEAYVESASADLAREIRRTCDKINMASVEVSSLCPVLDSGFTEMNQAFFMSVKPDATPLIVQEYNSVEEVISQVEKIVEIFSIVHSLGLTQLVCNLKSEWYVKADGTLLLLFPGVRGLLDRIRSKKTEASAVNVRSDLKELCRVFEQLLNQLSIDVSAEKVEAVQSQIASYRKKLKSGTSSLSEFRNLLSEIRDEVSHMPDTLVSPRDSSKNSDGKDSSKDKDFVKSRSRERNKTVLFNEMDIFSKNESVSDTPVSSSDDDEYPVYAEDETEEDFFGIKEEENFEEENSAEEFGKGEFGKNANVFSQVIKDFPNEGDFSSGAFGYGSLKSDAFNDAISSSPPPYESVSKKFSSAADEVYGGFGSGLFRSKQSSGISYEEEAPRRNKFLIIIAVLLVLAIVVLAGVIVVHLTSGSKETKKVSESLSVFDGTTPNRMLEDRNQAKKENMFPDSDVRESYESRSSDMKFPELDEAVFVDNPVSVPEPYRPKKDETLNPLQKNSLQKDPLEENKAVFDQVTTNEHLDIRMFLDNISTPIPPRDVSQVISFLESEDFEIRIAALKTLGEKAVKDDVRIKIAIEAMLNDEDPLVRGFASFALVSYADQDAIPILEDQLEYEKNDVVTSAIQRAISKARSTTR